MKKSIKKGLTAASIFAVVVSTVVLSGCSNISMDMFEDEDVRADVDDIMDAIETQDGDHIYYRYLAAVIDKEEYDEGISYIFDAYKGERVSTKLLDINVKTTKNINDSSISTIKHVVYRVQTTENAYRVTLSYYKSGRDNYILYNINLSDDLDYVVNRGIENYRFPDWAMLILNLISYGIMVAALILCIKTKIKKKALWIILILLQTGIAVTIAPNYFNVKYSIIHFIGISEYLLYAHGGTVTRVLIHVFSIVFLFVRKGLHRKYLYEQKMLEADAERKQEQIEQGFSEDAQDIGNGAAERENPQLPID